MASPLHMGHTPSPPNTHTHQPAEPRPLLIPAGTEEGGFGASQTGGAGLVPLSLPRSLWVTLPSGAPVCHRFGLRVQALERFCQKTPSSQFVLTRHGPFYSPDAELKVKAEPWPTQLSLMHCARVAGFKRSFLCADSSSLESSFLSLFFIKWI